MVLRASLAEAISEVGRVEDELLKLKSLHTATGGVWKFLGLGHSPTAVRRTALERHMAELTVQIGIHHL